MARSYPLQAPENRGTSMRPNLLPEIGDRNIARMAVRIYHLDAAVSQERGSGEARSLARRQAAMPDDGNSSQISAVINSIIKIPRGIIGVRRPAICPNTIHKYGGLGGEANGSVFRKISTVGVAGAHAVEPAIEGIAAIIID